MSRTLDINCMQMQDIKIDSIYGVVSIYLACQLLSLDVSCHVWLGPVAPVVFTFCLMHISFIWCVVVHLTLVLDIMYLLLTYICHNSII